VISKHIKKTIMKKILVFATVAFVAFNSCRKEATTRLPGNVQTLSKSTVSASGNIEDFIGVDLTGFQLLDMCSHEIWTTLSGTAVFYIGRDGTFKSIDIYNFVFQDRNATRYRGEYNLDLEPMTWFGGLNNTYKVIFNPQNGGSNKTLLALTRINAKENGLYTILIDSGTIECH